MSDAMRIDTGQILSRPETVAQPAWVGPSVHVLHLFKYFRPDFTGDGLYFEKLIPRLERQGVRNEVAAEITTRRRGDATAARLFGRFHMGRLNPMLLLWFTCNAWRFDIVHVHSAVDRLFAYHLLARLFGCRVVQSCTLDDGIGNLVRSYRERFRPMIRHLCTLIDDVVTISPRLYENTLNVMPATHVHFIPQGVTVPPRAPAQVREAARREFGLSPEDTVLLFVGGLCVRKDVRFLVDNHPTELERLHLLLVGPTLEDGYVAALRDAIAQSPAAARIRVTGLMEDPARAYLAADAFVFASHREGCPNVVLEAMAHHLPVIARNLRGTTDSVIDHGRSGLLFKNAAEYQEAVRFLARDPESRRRMGEVARAYVAAAYDMESVALRYATLYHKA